jgi:hypothetical protein
MMMLVSTTVRSPSTSSGNLAIGQRFSHSPTCLRLVLAEMQRNSNGVPFS